ncbi:hypothetical protein O987_27120 [Comamonas testosteroni TK102]|uniref:Uncharacterized protein n=1 Tax=Comamonas testosteroni TK102 TaxID=1392005 RepID=A0A076PZZ9_COMTE|nr:hypothetical protein O987_27120 [Comamonas testosteroni TK102]
MHSGTSPAKNDAARGSANGEADHHFKINSYQRLLVKRQRPI